MMRDLADIRAEIDEVDSQLVKAFEKRMALAEQVAEYKLAAGKQVFDKSREEQKLHAITEAVTQEYLKKDARELFSQLMGMSRKRQYQLLLERGMDSGSAFEEVPCLPEEHPRIVFQGVEGAYSQAAMQAYFKDSSDSYHVDTWRDAMEAITNKEADYAVLPIENSSAGSVSENYDLLVEYDTCIVGEQVIRVEHCLLSNPGATLQDIKTVYSHPQALMQCSRFLNEHREWEKQSLRNTAASAKKVKDEGKKCQAAIASRLTAEIYGLDILEENIQDYADNCTRFVIVTAKKRFIRDARKISICFAIPHVSGSLYRILSHFYYNDLNMNKIESRPLGERNWEYRFFIDFEGNLHDGAVRNALQGLAEETEDLKILGNY